MADMVDMMRKIVGLNINIITIHPSKENPRVCDYCNTTLVAPYGLVVDSAYLTDYGLACSNCLEGMYAIEAYRPGEDVSGTNWYMGYYLD